ncbi:Phosphate-import protein PhnD precursor [Planctomycetes bacterium Pla163]|uniref:Phosphate-import protein PhnD n=1 Tax=Rohdeia mirabilis TaxID=2528008 RepID=A0A518CZU1_9BACT|nr:Phosphate-import protein PhnD precursor [Planctomycetes bacterium Pla163]
MHDTNSIGAGPGARLAHWSLRVLAAAVLCCSTGCGDLTIGSEARPFRMYFVPSMDAQELAGNADAIAEHVSRFVSQELYGQDTGFYVRARIPMNYVAIVEAFGTQRADFAALNSFGFVLAKDERGYDIEPLLTVVRGDDERSYKGQIIARADSGIDSVEDLNGKTFAYTDPASSAGFMLPRRLFESAGVRLGNTSFAGKHDSVVSMVYQGTADAGATYYSPPMTRVVDGVEVTEIRDARSRVKTQYPDVEEVVKIVAFTEDVPNDPWCVRGSLDPDPERSARIKAAVAAALIDFASTDEGRRTLEAMYNVSGLAQVGMEEYAGIREMVGELMVELRAEGTDLEEELLR